jgi:transposase
MTLKQKGRVKSGSTLVRLAPNKARKSRSKIKTMLIIFFDIRGVVHHEYILASQTVNAKFYVEVLKRLRERVRLARPELWTENAWILHQDNAPLHTVLVTREFLAKNKITTMDHPPYSPDLAPCDFYLFPKVKNIMRGEHFVDADTIKRETTKLLKELTEEDMQHCFQESEKRWTSAFCQGDSTSRVTTSPFQNNLIWIFGEPSARTFCTHLVCHILQDDAASFSTLQAATYLIITLF